MNSWIEQLRSETGAVNAGTIFGLLLLAGIIYVALGVTQSDTAHFGGVPAPGTGTVSLVKGDTEIYYAQAASPAGLAKPADLSFLITDSAGNAVEADARGDKEKEIDGGEGVAQLVGDVSIPADGVYTVEVTGAAVAAPLNAQLTFGQGPVAAMSERIEKIGDQLLGPVGVLLLLALGALYFVPRLQRKTTKTETYNEF